MAKIQIDSIFTLDFWILWGLWSFSEYFFGICSKNEAIWFVSCQMRLSKSCCHCLEEQSMYQISSQWSETLSKGAFLLYLKVAQITYVSKNQLYCNLVCRIDVHAGLLILRKNSPLHGLILVCTFIVFEKKIPLHVYFPAFLLVFALHVY